MMWTAAQCWASYDDSMRACGITAATSDDQIDAIAEREAPRAAEALGGDAETDAEEFAAAMREWRDARRAELLEDLKSAGEWFDWSAGIGPERGSLTATRTNADWPYDDSNEDLRECCDNVVADFDGEIAPLFAKHGYEATLTDGGPQSIGTDRIGFSGTIKPR